MRAKPQRIAFCTIATKARLGYCRALVASLRRLHPESSVFGLYLGPEQIGREELGWPEGMIAVSLDELGLVGATADDLRNSELTNEQYLAALQPWLLGWALDHGGAPAVFVADDFYVLGSLSLLAEQASAAGAALVRRSPPLSRTTAATLKLLPEEPSIELHLIGIGASGKPFLEAWKQEVRRAVTTSGISMEHFVDRAADSFSTAILDDLRYNAGWWNVAPHEPILGGPRGGPGEHQVVALHLHKFDFRRPHQIVSRPDGWLPLRLSEHIWLAELCAQYAETVRRYQPADPWPTAVPIEHDTGIRGDHFAMACWTRAQEAADVGRSAPPPDQRLAGDEVLVAWLSSPPDGSALGVSRYLLEVYRARPDLQVAFPDLVEAPAHFLRWARTHGRTELTIPGGHGRTAWPDVPSTRRAPVPRRLTGPRTRLGVNVVGLLGSHLGLGEAARQTVEALSLAGIPTRTHAITETVAPALRQSSAFRHGEWCPINLLHMNPPELLAFRNSMGQPLMGRRYNVGLWMWETETIPAAWRKALRVVDEIWVPSDWVRAAFVKETSLPVITIPLSVPRPWHPAYMDRRYLGLGDEFTFLFVCDLNSSIRRKNLRGLVAAFNSAFSPNEGPRLVIKTVNGELNVGDFEELLLTVRDRPDIGVYDRVLSAYEKAALLDAGDCYVSLHRAEAFGLTMAEAMALGKPVVATAYSGNLTYMTPQNSYLVEFQLEPVGVDWDRYPGDDVWADPDLQEAGRVLRYVWEHQNEAQERGRLAARAVEITCSPEVVGPLMRARIETIWSGRLTWSARHYLQSRPSPGRVLRHLGAKVRSWSR